MKTVLITGTSQGLGLEIANLFLENGYRVVGLSRKEPNIQSANYEHYKVDITDYTSVDLAISKIKNIDILVNNAAVFKMSTFENTNLYTIDKIIDTNLKGAIYVTRSALPKMSTGGKIIFINSVAGLRELEQQSVYCASKHALKAFAGVIGQELQGRIAVSSIHPGGINTPLWNLDNPYPCGPKDEAMDPKEVAQMVKFVAESSPKTNYKTVTMFPTVEWH